MCVWGGEAFCVFLGRIIVAGLLGLAFGDAMPSGVADESRWALACFCMTIPLITVFRASGVAFFFFFFFGMLAGSASPGAAAMFWLPARDMWLRMEHYMGLVQRQRCVNTILVPSVWMYE